MKCRDAVTKPIEELLDQGCFKVRHERAALTWLCCAQPGQSRLRVTPPRRHSLVSEQGDELVHPVTPVADRRESDRIGGAKGREHLMTIHQPGERRVARAD